MVVTRIDKKIVSHLYRRAGFGITEDEIDDFKDKNYEDLVEDLLSPEKQPEFAEDIPRRYHLELNFPDTHAGLQSYWIYRMINTTRPLEEKMALFWHHIFATSIGKSEHTPSAVVQINTFRSNGLSKMRDILLDLAKDPAMLFWLDNSENHKGEPNENWGRELLELFSMGVGNYTEDDIKEASRAFTGWTFVQPLPLDPYARYDSEFLYVDDDHDPGEKTFLGQTGKWNGEDIIEIVARQPATAKFISRHLYNFFVADEPQVPAWNIVPPNNPEAIRKIVKIYMDTDGNIKEILRFIFNSDFFKKSKFKKIKSPVELVTGIIKINRKHRFPGPDFSTLSGIVSNMGQAVLTPPTVEGWHTGKEWIDAGTLNERVNFAVDSFGDKEISNMNFEGSASISDGVKIIVQKIRDENKLEPENLLDRCLELLGYIEITDETRKELISDINRDGPLSFSTDLESRSSRDRIIMILQAIVSTIEFQFG